MKTLLMFLCLTAIAQAVEIKNENKVFNQPPGYCAWACLETLGNEQQIPSLKNLLENRKKGKDIYALGLDGRMHIYPKNYGYDSFIKKKLKELNVTYQYQSNNRSTKLIEKYIETHGCMVFVKMPCGLHAVILTELGDKNVKFFDPNEKEITHTTREWFDQAWYGTVYVLTK